MRIFFERDRLAIAFAVLGLVASASVRAQDAYWSAPDAAHLQVQAPAHAALRTLDLDRFQAQLQQAGSGTVLDLAAATAVIELPMPDGGLRAFRFIATPVMHPDLQARYPMIHTYSGVAVDDASVRVKFDVTPLGLHAMVLGASGGDVFIDPLPMGGERVYRSSYKRDLPHAANAPVFQCGYAAVNDVDAAAEQTRAWIQQMGTERVGDCHFRIYRMALACTGEYANYFGSNTGNNDRSFALAAMATTLNRVNGIYERDATLSFQLVANNDQLVFLDPATDGYTNDDTNAMLDENQTVCDAVIGSGAYDIGHVFGTSGGGVAALNSVCTGNKAQGVTSLGDPVGDAFDIDYVCHEIGHQFGANHTQNNDCQRADAAAVEVGSGITIMGYAGVCDPNVAAHSDAMFGGYSMAEIASFVTVGSGSTCPSSIGLVNSAPTANAGVDRTIPKSTPFLLTGTATDANANDALTYSWEQMDFAAAAQPPVSTNTGGPCFRPFLPVSTPGRYFPNLPAIIANTTPTWEVLSSVGRQYKFRLTVRDNAVGGGCNGQDIMLVTVNATAGPFVVTQPNTAVTWAGGSSQTITWNVAGTTAAPVSCANVDILLSTDGGYTYPYTLATATPNDGTQQVTLPQVATTTARVMVRANGNIFFDLSNADFTITGTGQVRVAAKAWLEGCYVQAATQMHDSLRVHALLPTAEPYTALGFAQSGGGGGESIAPALLTTSGADAIVDWVRLELRASGSPGTVVATRQALLQRDGDIVDTDGVSPVTFAVAAGNYFVVVRHRNHLGCMSAAALALSSTATVVDFRSAATATYGTNARKTIGGAMALWMGNVVNDGSLRYTGASNDRDPILVRIGGLVPTAVANGYYVEDSNMDGQVRYTGTANDRDPLFVNVGGLVPTATRAEQLP